MGASEMATRIVWGSLYVWGSLFVAGIVVGLLAIEQAFF